MKNINQIVDKLKVKISVRDKREDAPLDKEIAKELKITSNNLSVHKKRGTIPIVKIMDWCYKNDVSMKEIFYEGK